MDKYNFLLQLSERLKSLPEHDRQRSVDYYGEMIADRMEEGLSEEEAVAAIGNADDIARTIISEAPVTPAPVPVKERNGLRWWEITLLVLGAPVWASLLLAAAAVVFSVWISLWSVVISLYASAVALGASTLGCVFGSFFMIPFGVGPVLIAWGAAFMCAGLVFFFLMLGILDG